MTEDNRYDVIIVGARIAGSVLAAILGDAGYNVLLVDRARFPSPTLSTHFFRGGGLVAVLDRLGVLEEVLALGCPPLSRSYVYAAGAAQALVEPPQNPGAAGYSLSVRREPLDEILNRRARRSNIQFRDRARVTELLWEGERVVGIRMRTAAGEESARARIVVGADGRHSFVARAVDAPTEVEDPAARAIYYAYVRDYAAPGGGAPDGPEFSFRGDEIAYTFPSDAALTCLAISVNLETFRWLKQDFRTRFWEQVGRHEGIAPRLQGTTIAGQLLACGPETNYVRVPVGPGWALVGDAGLHLDPWTGYGMDLASTHATYLAAALLSWFAGETDEAQALDDYHARRNENGLKTYHTTVTLARDLRQVFAS